MADFAAGDGALLRAILKHRRIRLVCATDIDRRVLDRLATTTSAPIWLTGKCDFLSARSRAASPIIQTIGGRLDLALLNPPFSCRGSHRVTARLGHTLVKCSVALAFVVLAVEQLRDGGEVIALLPRGTLTNEKDVGAWRHLRSVTECAVIEEFSRTAFRNCFPETVLVRFRRKGPANDAQQLGVHSIAANTTLLHEGAKPNIWLFRGRVRVSDAAAHNRAFAQVPFVHTTALRHGQVDLQERRTDARLPTVSGPAVLIPRVGMPAAHKLAILLTRKQVVLSECVLALKCSDAERAILLRAHLLRQWDNLAKCYGGTCAPFLTVARLHYFLVANGYCPEVEGRLRGLIERYASCPSAGQSESAAVPVARMIAGWTQT